MIESNLLSEKNKYKGFSGRLPTVTNMIDEQITHMGLFLVAGLATPILIKLIQYLLAPNIPRLKQSTTTYECGEKPIGDAQVRYNTQFFVTIPSFLPSRSHS
jgi:NADH:ubiquinone oxidoreductase subunit 3 (subunit A)